MSEQFTSDVSKWVDKAHKNLAGILRQSAQEASQRIIMTTPVDTGLARGGWWAALNQVQVGGENPDKPGNATVSRANKVAAQMKPGDVFTLANNVKYIKKLEYGSSKQAPQGMVRVVQGQMQTIVQNLAAELK